MESVNESSHLDEAVSEDGRDELYVVSITKFLLLYVITLGGYMLYWTYRNWKCYRYVAEVDIMPVMRGVFWPFFIYSLIARIKGRAQVKNEPCDWHAGAKSLLIISLVIISQLIPFVLDASVSPWIIVLTNIATLVAGAYLLVSVQRLTNRLANDAQGCSNSDITDINIVWIILGGVYWVVVFGILLFGEETGGSYMLGAT